MRPNISRELETYLNVEVRETVLFGGQKVSRLPWHGKLNKHKYLLHDNVRSHKARTTQGLLRNFGWEVWKHPPYSPDLAPCDFSRSTKIWLLKKDSYSTLALGTRSHFLSSGYRTIRATFPQMSAETLRLFRDMLWCVCVILYFSALFNKVFFDLLCSSVNYIVNALIVNTTQAFYLWTSYSVHSYIVNTMLVSFNLLNHISNLM